MKGSKMNPFYLNVKRMGNYIYDRYIDENGEEKTRVVKYKPTLFVSLNNPTSYQKKHKKKDLYGNVVYPVLFDSMSEAIAYKDESAEMGRDVLGMDSFEFAYIADVYPNVDPKDLRLKNYIRCSNVDIEVTAPEMPDPTSPIYEIDAITHYDSIDDKYYAFDLVERLGDGSVENWCAERSILEPEIIERVVYFEFDSEQELLAAYIKLYQEKPPSIINGWNVEKFDIPYIIGRIIRNFGEDAPKLMSPFNRYSSRNVTTRYGEQTIYEIHGISVIDTMDLYKKNGGGTPPNYKLETIAQIELGKGKVQYDCEINELREKHHQLYIDYNIGDVQTVKEIIEKRNFNALTIFMAYYMKMNFVDILGSIRPWDAKLFDAIKKEGMVVPMFKPSPIQPYGGAFVKEPLVGAYRWLISLDITSLYPTIIRILGASYETYLGLRPTMPPEEDLINRVFPGFTDLENCAIAPNGAMYRKDIEGIIPKVITDVFLSRVEEKKLAAIAGKNIEHLTRAISKTDQSYKGDFKFDPITPITDFETLNKLELQVLYQMREDAIASNTIHDTAQNALKLAINSLYGALTNLLISLRYLTY